MNVLNATGSYLKMIKTSQFYVLSMLSQLKKKKHYFKNPDQGLEVWLKQ
jgi:hypothetical protein